MRATPWPQQTLHGQRCRSVIIHTKIWVVPNANGLINEVKYVTVDGLGQKVQFVGMKQNGSKKFFSGHIYEYHKWGEVVLLWNDRVWYGKYLHFVVNIYSALWHVTCFAEICTMVCMKKNPLQSWLLMRAETSLAWPFTILQNNDITISCDFFRLSMVCSKSLN